MGKWSWVITTVGTLAFLYLLTQWVTSPLHASLFQWGPSAEWKLLGDNHVFEPVYTGEIRPDLLMTFAFFFLAQWILEKRMEGVKRSTLGLLYLKRFSNDRTLVADGIADHLVDRSYCPGDGGGPRNQIDLKCIFHPFSHPVLSLLSGFQS